MNSVFLTDTAPANRVGSPETRPDRQAAEPQRYKMKAWRVIHACERARDVLPVIEGQVAVGMRPYIVTPQGAGAAELYLGKADLEQPDTLSLIRAWQDVRNWRKSLLECDPENTADVVHTHSFPSGMAGVRNLSCVVYDLKGCIEELALSGGQCDRGSWMGRSFRVAEQFILSRAKAVIVHSTAMKAAVQERGAAAENVFLIPDPVDTAEGIVVDGSSMRERFGIDRSVVTYFSSPQQECQGEALSPATMLVLEAFALVAIEAAPLRLLISASAADFSAIQGHAERLGIAQDVVCVEAQDASAAISAADVVIVGGETSQDEMQARQPNRACVQALVLSRALLAADVPCNRDVSPDGRGCLWFKDGDARDLGYRMVFLAANPEFRTTLGATGRNHIVETRNSTAVGRQYDAAYRHALKQKRSGGPGQMAAHLMPITSVI